MSLSPSLLLLSALVAQEQKDSSFWRDGDGRLAIVTVGATAAIAIFDERIARWTRQPSVQGDSNRHDLVSAVTVVNEVPLTIAAVATYGAGRLAGWNNVADVGLHVTEALVATEVVAEVVRVALGRARPRASPDNAFELLPGRGLTRFDYRAFPSLHAAVAFATAASLSEEMRLRKAPARRYLTPLLYSAAMIPGVTRLYLDQHWASDVLAGSVLGTFLGIRIVRYAHGRQTKIDRVLLGARVSASPDGMLIGWSIRH